MYYTKCKNGNNNTYIDNHPYYIIAETDQDISGNYPTDVTFYAVSAKNNKKIGMCSIRKLSEDSTGIFITELALLDHKFDHCGIGSTLLKVVESYAFWKLLLDYSTLICSPDDGYEEIAPNLYFSTGYAEISSLNQLFKSLDENTLQEKINIDEIKFYQINKQANKNNEREM